MRPGRRLFNAIHQLTTMKTKTQTPAHARKTATLKTTVVSEIPEEVIELVPLTLHLKRILVPCDFSEPAIKALRYAVAFAKQLGAKISVLHVTDPLPLAAPEVGFAAMNYIPGELPGDDARSRLEMEAERHVPDAVLDKVVVRTGVPFDEICRVAKELETDLIILNTHGYTGLKHVLMGSTAEKVVRRAGCPVLVVREKEREFA